MKRTLAAATCLTLATATSAGATDTTPTVDAVAKHLAGNANAENVRTLLKAQNYKNVSRLQRDAHGMWTGTAEKDGVRRIVSVKLPPNPSTSLIN